MARVIINNTKFNPFSFEEMIKPLALYAQEYRAQEDAINTLATNASIWNGIADEQSDPYAYSLYKGYADDLASQAEILSKEGLSPTSRRAMLKLKERYNSEILPIETASKRRQTLAAEQRQALAQNPTLRYERYASNMSLDDFILNPTLDYGRSYSGALLTQQAADIAATIKNIITDKGKWTSLGLPFKYERKIRKGSSIDEVLTAIQKEANNGDPETVKFLRSIVDQVITSSGVSDWADDETMKDFRAFANQGLYKAIGSTNYDTITDDAGLAAYRSRISNRNSGGNNNKKDDVKGVKPTSLLSKAEKENHSKIQNKINNWKKAGYLTITSDGFLAPTNRGIKYANTIKNTTTYGGSHSYWVDTDFRALLKELGSIDDKTKTIGSSTAYGSTMHGEKTLKGWNRTKSKKYTDFLNTGYDTDREVEFVHSYGTSAEQERAKDLIRDALGNSGAKVFTYKNPKEGYVYDNKTIDKKKFVSDYKVLSSRGSKYGQYFTIEDGDGEQFIIKVPGVHEEQQQSAIRYYLAAEDAYKNLARIGDTAESIYLKMQNNGLSFSDLSKEEQDILIEEQSLNDTYKDILWEAENAQGNITRGYTTDNIETD